MKSIGHYELLLSSICIVNNWKVVEQPVIDYLGESGVQIYLTDTDHTGVVLLEDEDKQLVASYMIVDSCIRDNVFKHICENYVRFSHMTSLEELELKLVIKGAFA